MKPTNSKTKDFDTVKTFRKIKDKISTEIKNMSFNEFQAYLDKPKSTAVNKD